MIDYGLTFDLEPEDPGEWAEESTTSWYSGTIRCDDALPGNALPGCIHSYVTSTYDTSTWPELADHVRDAQANGAKGGPSTHEPLHRLIDPYWQSKTAARPARRACRAPRARAATSIPWPPPTKAQQPAATATFGAGE